MGDHLGVEIGKMLKCHQCLYQFKRLVLEPSLFRCASAGGTACIQAAVCLWVLQLLNKAKSEGFKESVRG